MIPAPDTGTIHRRNYQSAKLLKCTIVATVCDSAAFIALGVPPTNGSHNALVTKCSKMRIKCLLHIWFLIQQCEPL